MAMGRAQSAITDFSAAIADQPTAPRWFHLAQARLRLQQRKEANQAYEQAVSLRLEAQQLHVLERADYVQLVHKLVP